MRRELGRSLPLADRLLAYWRRRGWRGFTRLHDLLRPPPQREFVVRTRYGTSFGVNPHHSVDHHVILEGFYESEVLEALRPGLTRAGAVLWVVGANFGLHAVTAKFLYPRARVIAFEPFPQMADRLEQNCRLNDVEVELHRLALAADDGVRMFHANASSNPGMSTLRPMEGGAYELQFEVPTATAARLIASGLAPAPDVLLVDAEGAEAEIFAGFGVHLSDPRLALIVFEAPNDFLTAPRPAALHAALSHAGFHCEKLERNEDTAHACSNFVARRQPPARPRP